MSISPCRGQSYSWPGSRPTDQNAGSVPWVTGIWMRATTRVPTPMDCFPNVTTRADV